MKLNRLVPAALAAATLVSACGGSPRIGDREYIAATVETLLEECAEENGPAVYDILSQDARRIFVQAGGVLEGCQAVTDLGDAEEVPASSLFYRAEVTAIEKRGDQARVAIRVGDRYRSTVDLLDTGMLWFVNGPPRYELVGEDDLP